MTFEPPLEICEIQKKNIQRMTFATQNMELGKGRRKRGI
jgi:hypothetical protein